MREFKAAYKAAAASQAWLWGQRQQIPLSDSTTNHDMRPSLTGAALLAGSAVSAIENAAGVGRLPALGWNSWNAFQCDISEAKVMTAANQIISLGLKDIGYEYVNVDDCWSVKNERDSTTNQLIPDPVKFPNGIDGLADAIHGLGLKFGLYGSAGTMTCAGYPGQIGFESLDASTFAAWGVDYFKYDNCFFPSNWTDPYNACLPDEGGPYPNGTCPGLTNLAPPDYDWAQSNTAHRYAIMRDALLAQNRTILYSLCEWGTAHVELWGNETAESWRMSGDITPDWARIATILNENSFLTQYINFWGHPDMDMLEVGNGDLTFEENRSHFAFWAALKSPIIIGTALDLLPSAYVDILKNQYLIAFNQDPIFGGAATPYKWGTNPDWTFNATNPAEYWSGASSAGTLVLALNTLDTNATREILWSEVPQLAEAANGPACFQVTEIWSGEDLGCVATGISEMVASHDTIGYLVGEAC